MGNGAHYKTANVRLTKAQANRIRATSQGGEWYKVVDPVTGAIKYLRKSENKKKRNK